MRQQVVFAFELFDAVFALEFALFCVVTSLNVALKIGKLRKWSQTEFTFVRFLSSMHANVSSKRGVIAEHFITTCTLERSFSGVTSDVRIQIAFLAKAAITV